MDLGRKLVAACLLVAAAPVLSYAQFFGSDSAARVVNLTGQVSVLKDSEPWALQVGSLVHVKQVIVTGSDGFAVLQVSDGSTFEVYPNSRLTFRNNPGNLKDLLDVWIGRVKVHIEKLGGRPNHNRIHTPTAVISVRGTTFDVAVESEDETLVAVEEGQVAVQHAIRPVGEPKLLNAGDYLRVYRDQPLAEKAVDRGAVVRTGLRAAAEAFYRVIYRNPQVPGSGGGTVPRTPTGGTGGGGVPGDTEPTPPPPPPPSN